MTLFSLSLSLFFLFFIVIKVYALTKERDTLRREQSRKSDAAALLKEKDEIINQVMAEGRAVRNSYPYILVSKY